MTDILLIRHGETDWNAEKRLQGHLDIGLNRVGVRQADALGRALRAEPIDAVIASDLSRAIDTARPIAEAKDLPVCIDAVLRERCYGAFEGLRYDEIESRFPEAYAAWRARDPDARFPAGERVAETLREFTIRSIAAVAATAKAFPHGRIVVITHGGVLECIYRTANGIGFHAPRDFEIRNAGINRLTWESGRFTVSSWCELAHLNDLALDEIDK